MTAIHLNGFGLHTSLARGFDANIDALLNEPKSPESVNVRFGAEERAIPYHLLADAPLDEPESRFENTLHDVIVEALDSARLTRRERRSMGIFIGSSCGEMPLLEAQYRYNLSLADDSVPMLQTSGLGNLANRLREPFGIQGPDFSFYTACTASANGLLAAASMIRAGLLEHALVIAVETCNATTALGFSGLQLITSDVCAPSIADEQVSCPARAQPLS